MKLTRPQLRTRFILCPIFCITTLFSAAQLRHSPASHVISYPAGLQKDVANDLQYLLQLSTGDDWEARQDASSNSGVILLVNPSHEYKTGESCLVTSDGSSYAKFEAPTINGLIYGVYKYLRDLGFKFYLPDSLYTIVPKLQTVFKKTESMETPFLRIRDFFGTGGLGSGKTDPDHAVQKAWQLWKWRNGFGAEFQLGGHVGETFNLANSSTLQQNPSWTATPIMKNGKTDPSTKLNYFNPAAVDFFTDWVIRKFTDKNYKAPPVYIRDMVSIEPADGGGYATTPAGGSELKTISDQVFNSANVAAKKLDVLFPDQPNLGVNLYAYSEHADVPNFSLNPRVFVQIIPYQFQNVAYGPAFIKRWSEKVKRFGLYDYFKYPDSHWDMPGGYNIDDLMKRAINAAQAGSEGTTYETSYSKFATAIPLWVLSQYMCTGNTDWHKNYDGLISDLYGSAAPIVKNLFEMFYHQAQFATSDLINASDLLQQALRSSSDPGVQQRLNELKLYLSYVDLYLKSQDEANGDLEQRMLPVEKMAWTLYQQKIIDSYRIMQLVSYSFLNAQTPDKNLAAHYHKLHLETFPESNDPDVLWKTNYRYSNEELQNVSNDFSGSKRQRGLPSHTFATINDEIAAAQSNYAPKANVSIQGNFLNRGYFTLFSEKPATIGVSWSLTNAQGSPPKATLSGSDKNYSAVYDYPLNSPTGKLSISVPAGESVFFINANSNTTYTVQLQLNGVYCYFDGSPRGKMNFPDDKGVLTYAPPFFPTYVYVPKNTSEVQYKVQLNALKIIAPDGSNVSSNLLQSQPGGFQLRSFGVPAKFSGRFWQVIVSGNFNFQFLNIPDRYFLFLQK